MSNPSTTRKESQRATEQETNSSTNNVKKKLQCDLCKLSYPSEKELTEHLVSLMHHNKLKDKHKNVPHCCSLCGYTCYNMADYRTHIATEKHQRKLSVLKGEPWTGSKFKKKTDTNRWKGHSGNASDFHRSQRVSSDFNSITSDYLPNDDFSAYPNWHNRQLNRRQFNEDSNNSHYGRHTQSRGNRGQYNHLNWSRQHHQRPGSETHEPWGSGVYGKHNNGEAYYFRGNGAGRIVSKKNYDFTKDNVDLTGSDWDEHSLVRQEQFLADISKEPYKSPLPSFCTTENNKDKFEEERLSRVNEFYGRDRKRPRSDDVVEESLPKSLKSFDSTSSDYNHNLEPESLGSSNLGRMSPHDKSAITDASNSILEKAERLCKELRNKNSQDTFYQMRKSETSSGEKSNSTKYKEGQNKLDKNVSNNFQQHSQQTNKSISSAERAALNKVDVTKSDSTNSAVDTHSKVERNNSKAPDSETSSGSQTIKTLTSRKAHQKALTSPLKARSPVHVSTDNIYSPPAASSIAHYEDNMDSLKKNRQRTLSSEYGAERSAESAEKTLQKSTVKSISKDHLQKLVNAPRSRDERLQLAKLLHSKGHKYASSTALRSTPQLEGLYDSEVPDINTDLGDLPTDLTIKIEDLSDGVRQQLMDLIGEDIREVLNASGRIVPGNVVEVSDDDCQRSYGNELRPHSPHRFAENIHTDNLEDVPLPKKKKKKEIKKAVDIIPSSKPSHATHMNPNQKLLGYAQAKDSGSLASPCVSAVSNSHLKEGDINSTDQHLSTPPAQSTADKTSKLNDFQEKRPKSPYKPITSRSKSPIPSQDKSVLNKDNVNTRYPTLMDTVRSAPPSSPSPQTCNSPLVQVEPSSSLSCSTPGSIASSSSVSTQPAHSLPSYKQFTLPPSTWLADKASSPLAAKSSDKTQATLAKDIQDKSDLKNANGILKTDTAVIDIEELGRDTPQSTCTEETVYERDSSQSAYSIPEELLSLSEREEDIKQEMVSLDLRLTRLHRLLEQAVAQINKCTERRNQLLEETQVISTKRITLLRETAAVRLRGKSKEHTPNATLEASRSKESSSKPADSTSLTPSDGQGNSGTTLSKEDWLAKFSSFLPPETVLKDKVSTPSTLSSKPEELAAPQSEAHVSQANRAVGLNDTVPRKSAAVLETHVSMNQTVNLSADRTIDSSPASNPPQENHQVMKDLLTNKGTSADPLQQRLQEIMSLTTNNTTETTLSSHSAFSRHLEEQSDNSLAQPTLQSISRIFSRPLLYLGSFKSAENLPLRTPVIMLNDSAMLQTGAGDTSSAHYSVPAQATKPAQANSAADDSDSGSITSRVSGSSLGEKISRYCQNTPEASMDSACKARPPGNSGLQSVIKPCFVSLSRVEDVLKKDKMPVTMDTKTAEALHLLERNKENDEHVTPSSIMSSGVKKKKMKTRQERDISDLRRKIRHRILSTSSSDGENRESRLDEAITCGSAELVSRTGNISPERYKQAAQPSKTINSEMSPSKSFSVVRAECDSSTNIGVDRDSINERLRALKEMRENFDKAFGLPSKTLSDREVVLLSDDETTPTSKGENQNNLDIKAEENSKKSCDYLGSDMLQTSLSKKSCFPSKHGPVVDLHVFHSELYVAYCNYGVAIYSLGDTNKKALQEIKFPDLQCMTVAELQGSVKVIVGCGPQLAFCNPKDVCTTQPETFDLGSPVKCLLVTGSLVYCGLDTGEIGVFDTMKMELKDRFICSDHPIHCLASAQEGSSRLICASSQDGTILVINAHTGLPLRILIGHSKTAFSLAVSGQLVYSGSGDSTVIAHNIHTGAIVDIINDNKGLIKCVYYQDGFLFTGGMDRLVRCYDRKIKQLIQVYYGAERTVICKICVHENMLITGNTTGAVDCIKLDYTSQNWCHKGDCKLNFGNRSHLFWHILEDHDITEVKKETSALKQLSSKELL
ncbi:zinc finger protein 106 [Biomphalaria glabrata]|nr:zinc finger protein 106 [Biomphalaria glabrata]